jgi:hypothetical protein
MAVSWVQVKVDDMRYGYPRTYSTDAFVGFHERDGLPTHFVVMNAHRQVLIMIMPGDDPARVSVIKGPYLFGADQDLSPATIDFVDVNHDSYLDLRLHVAGQTTLYLNDHRRHTFTAPASSQG